MNLSPHARYRRALVVLALLMLALAGSAGLGSAAAADPQSKSARVCSTPRQGYRACFALVLVQPSGKPRFFATPQGYGPPDIQSAYELSTTLGTGRTVAIVDAYDLPTAESDLGTYRSQYNLPACTTANGCFRKINQTGGTTAPTANASWGQEIALDLDMVSAACPYCKILLVEASSASNANLGIAVNQAVAQGAAAVSNSYGAPESVDEMSDDIAYYKHPGVAITAASGDDGYGTSYPAASPWVTAVGGTTLYRNSTNARGWGESAWSGAGSGCSASELKPVFQHDTGCTRRTTTDVSAVADPDTGVAVYDTYGSSGWTVMGGTSAASPIIASVYAQATPPPPTSTPRSTRTGTPPGCST
jgi:subtilase family serine protease